MEFAYEQGQVWRYNTRQQEPESLIVVVATEEHEIFGMIVNVAVVGLEVQNPHSEDGKTDLISHLPFAKDAIDRSVTECLGYADELPPFEEGYNTWKEAFLQGDAGIFTITVSEVVEGMEQVMNQENG